MNQHYSEYPDLDWSRCLEMAGNNEQLTKDLLKMFFDAVPQEHAAFKAAYSIKDYPALKDLAHRMRGALAYCVIPNLESALQLLEKAAGKEDKEQVAKFYAVVMMQLKKILPAEEENNN